MRSMLCAATVSCVVSGCAGAAPTVTIDVKARFGDWMPWVDFIPWDDGERYEFAVFVSFTEGVAFSDATFNVTSMDLPVGSTVQLSGPGLGDQAPYDAAFESNATFWTGDDFRLDAASDAANSASIGLRVAQLPPVLTGGVIGTENPAMVMRFDVTMGNFPRALVAHVGAGEASARAFTSTFGTGLPVAATTINYDGVRIFIPSPSWVPCAVIGAIALRRRR
jgi:hypothetical protein